MGSRLVYITIAYYMQKGGGSEGVQIACRNKYVINARSHSNTSHYSQVSYRVSGNICHLSCVLLLHVIKSSS